ncbi:MAG: cytidine deaminase [Haliscomenobacter sp.]|uniref:cytidine deaminase n=1 Tax=Haliscomenobacter sp. TaxID=2717303 RepID=UPI0029B1B3D2|nr:cytidine deaminase [Haliscomenobacter sp.]MDX2072212.1 cytidine deaminase [Haliscomenobacter sp.]
MVELKLQVDYRCYAETTELPLEYQELLDCAKKALDLSYSPYSSFKVGAAILLEDGTRVPGANQENASYPLCLCAERNALAVANIQYPSRKMVAMAVVAAKDDIFVSPCGACRQVIWENEQRNGAPITMLIQGPEGKIYRFKSIGDLLPFGFSGTDLE